MKLATTYIHFIADLATSKNHEMRCAITEYIFQPLEKDTLSYKQNMIDVDFRP